MKYLTLTIAAGVSLVFGVVMTMSLSTPGTATAGINASCCSPTSEFASLGKGSDFRAAHAEPTTVEKRSNDGHTMKVDVADQDPARVVWFHAESTPKATILVIHEWWGLNDQILNTAQDLYEQLDKQVDIVAVDLYDELVVTTRDAASAAMQKVDEQRCNAIIKAVLSKVKTEHIGTVGWCFGGGWSLQASLLAGDRAAACVMYYGMPEKDRNILKTLNAPVLFIQANQDKWIDQAMVEEFQQNMIKVGKTVKVLAYEADHAFANPSNPQFNKVATLDAWNESIAFFREHLLQ